jgi:hypothetical protein
MNELIKAPLSGHVVRERQSLVDTPTVKVRGNEVLWKHGNKIIDRCKLSKYRDACVVLGLDNLVRELDISSRGRVNVAISEKLDVSTATYDWRADEKRFISMCESDRSNYLDLLSPVERRLFQDRVMKQIEKLN